MLAATVSRAHFGLLFIPNNAHKQPPTPHPHPPTQIKPLWRRPPRSRVRLSAPLSHIMPINNRYWQRVAMATARCPRVLARQRKVARHTLVPSLTVRNRTDDRRDFPDSCLDPLRADPASPLPSHSLLLLLLFALLFRHRGIRERRFSPSPAIWCEQLCLRAGEAERAE